MAVSEQLERLGAPEKMTKRYEGYSDKQVSEGDFSGDPTGRQGIVYFVPAALEVMRPHILGDPPREAPDPPPDVTQPGYFNAKIKLFQPQLHELMSSARRAM